MNSEDLARQKLAIHTETEKLMQENTKRRNVSSKFLANFLHFELRLTVNNSIIQNSCAKRGATPSIYSTYLKTFLISTFTQHGQHVNK